MYMKYGKLNCTVKQSNYNVCYYAHSWFVMPVSHAVHTLYKTGVFMYVLFH